MLSSLGFKASNVTSLIETAAGDTVVYKCTHCGQDFTTRAHRDAHRRKVREELVAEEKRDTSPTTLSE